jgi:hypothetical protein
VGYTKLTMVYWYLKVEIFILPALLVPFRNLRKGWGQFFTDEFGARNQK